MLRQLFDTVNGKYQKSKKIATDSNYLRCHALLTALRFPLQNTCSCKQDRKERCWRQQFWQMERDILVRPTEMTRPVSVDHLQSWSRTFRSDQTEMVRSIWWTNGNFRNLGLNGKRPRTPFGDQSLLLSSSWSRGRKGGLALIASNLWGRRSPSYITALQYIDNLET